MTREDVYKLIDSEREYQNTLHEKSKQNPEKTFGGDQLPLTGEMILLRGYLRRAEEAYIATFGDPGEKPTMDVIRKLAGICVRCMENNDTPARNKE